VRKQWGRSVLLPVRRKQKERPSASCFLLFTEGHHFDTVQNEKSRYHRLNILQPPGRYVILKPIKCILYMERGWIRNVEERLVYGHSGGAGR
jgi:hypothetical protein